MADTLLSLSDKVNAATKPAPKPEQPKTLMGGDDLMAKAKVLADFNDPQKQYLKLFGESKTLIDTKKSQDPLYGEQVMLRLEKLTDEKLTDGMIDEADKIKIEFLQKEDPGRFNSGAAATEGFLNELTFGQMTRVYGGLGAVIQGRPYEHVVSEMAEKARLLQKAYPKSDIVGRAGAYLIPGSPVAKLFIKGAQAGTKLAAPIINRILRNPKLLEKAGRIAAGAELAATSAQTAASMGTGGAAIGAVRGVLGSDLDDFSIDRGVKQSLLTGAQSALFGAAVPVAARGVSVGAQAIAPTVKALAREGANVVAKGVAQLTGSSPEAIRAYLRDKWLVRGAAGREFQMGRALVDKVEDLRETRFLERQQADELLNQMPEIDASNVLSFFKAKPGNIRPDLKSGYDRLNSEWAPWLEKQLGVTAAKPSTVTTQQVASITTRSGGNLQTGFQRTTEVPAPKTVTVSPARLRQAIDDLQDAAKKAYGVESGPVMELIKEGAARARTELLVHAGKQGEIGQTYVGLMEKVAEKRALVNQIKGFLGRTSETRDKNAERFVTNLFGKNRTFIEAKMTEFDQKFGTNFVELARAARFARELGPKGKPNVFSNLTTGKSLLSTVTGGAIAGPPGAVVGAAIGSPALGASVIGASDKISGFVRRMFANPEALKRIKGLPGVSLEIRTIAKNIETAFVKDGPLTAASSLRAVADSPYFVGLVHYYDVAERELEKKIAQGAVQKSIAKKPKP